VITKTKNKIAKKSKTATNDVSRARIHLAGAWRDSESEAALLANCVQGICNGNREALGRLYDITSGKVFGLAKMIANSAEAAEEIVVEVYAEFWKSGAKQCAENVDVSLHLLKLCRTIAMRHVRERISDQIDVLDFAAKRLRRDGQRMLGAIRMDSPLRTSFDRLSEQQRNLISAAFLYGWSESEMAKVVGSTAASVKQAMRQALKVMREGMLEDGGKDEN
jgi:RNA polymerase sigma-70 factor, ECF subfamily